MAAEDGAGAGAWDDEFDMDGEPPLDTTPQTVALPPGTAVASVACGEHFSAIVTAEGDVLTFGRGASGQLGRPCDDEDAGLAEAPGAVAALAGVGVTQVALGEEHAAAIDARGCVYTWGAGEFGQLGTGSGKVQPRPVQVKAALQGVHVTQVACGWNFTVCCTSGGRVYSWGASSSGQLGHGSRSRMQTPLAIDALAGTEVRRVACGDAHAMALSSDGRVFAWGDASMGQLGNGSTTARASPVCLTDFCTRYGPASSIACGSAHSAAVVGDGLLYTWGANDRGQLGIGTKEACSTPQLVQALVDDGVRVMQVDLGVKYSLAVSDRRALYLWGRFHFGVHLGGEGRVEWDDPEEVTTAGVVEVAAAGRTHVLARTSGGACVMWGFVKPTARKPVTAPAPPSAAEPDAMSPPRRETPAGAGVGDGDASDVGAGGGAGAGAGAGSGSAGADDGDGGACGADEASAPGSPPPAPASPELQPSPPGSYGGALESLTAILDLSPHALHEQQPGLAATPAPRQRSSGDGAGAGARGSPAADGDGGAAGSGDAGTVAALRKQLAEARDAAARAQAEARAWETAARAANAKVEQAAAELARVAKDPAAARGAGWRRDKMKELAVAVVQARVGNAANTMAAMLKRNHLAAQSWAFRRWCTEVSISQVLMGQALRGERTSAGAGAAHSRARRRPATAADAKPLLRCIARLGRRTVWGAFQRWRNGADWARAEVVFEERTKDLRDQVSQAKKGKKLAHQRVKYMRNVMTGRLIKTQLRYGRDKLVSVLQARAQVGYRIAFERWRLHAISQQRSEALRRGRVKLQVGLDQVRAQRGQFERSQRELGHAKRLFSAFVAFHKWKTLQAEAKHSERVAELSAERRQLVGQLEGLLQHMQSVKQAQESEQRAATARGGTVLDDVKALEERILSWYNAEDGNGGGPGSPASHAYNAADPTAPSGSFVVGPESLAKSRAYDIARSVTSHGSPPPPSPAPVASGRWTRPSEPASRGATTPSAAYSASVAGLLSDAGLLDASQRGGVSSGFNGYASASGGYTSAVARTPATASNFAASPYASVPAFTFSAVQGDAGGRHSRAQPSAANDGHMTIRSLLGGTANDLSAARQMVESHLSHRAY